MIIGQVIGSVWATKKEDTLNGFKLMVVQKMDPTTDEKQDCFVAADCVGAGRGECVLIATGSSARKALGNPETPVDAAIIGIIDEVQV